MIARKAKQKDVGAIARVHVIAWQACYRSLLPDEFLDSLSLTDRENLWSKVLDQPGHDLLVCRSERQTVGFAACGPSRDLDKDASAVAEVYAIYVLPDFWGQGYGHVLWRRAEKDRALAKFMELDVWVLAANGRARKFYERQGCQEDPRANKDAHLGGVKLPEVRYVKQLGC